MFLKDIKTTDLERNTKYSFLIPIGSTEQHGPFLPFGTDTYWGDEVVKRIEKNVPNLIVTPTLEFSCSEEHGGFAGTMWLKPETLLNVLHDLCDSLAPYAKHIILLTSHGGNEDVLKTFLEKNAGAASPKIHRVFLESEELDRRISDVIGGPLDDHAGNIEISMMRKVMPELVIIPSDDYPKIPIANPWETGRLIDKSKDGIADNHPQWIVSEDIGNRIIGMIVEKALDDILQILEPKTFL